MVRANETWERKAAGQQNRNRQTLRKESSIDSLNPLGKQVMTGRKKLQGVAVPQKLPIPYRS